MRYISSIFDIIDRYDCIFCDINGVLTDGNFLFYGVDEVFSRLKDLGKHVVFVSNATRTKALVRAQLFTLGIDDYFLDKIVTSGDVLRHFINLRLYEFSELNEHNKFFVVGNQNFLEGTNGVCVTNNVEDADFLLFNGIVSDIKFYDPDLFKRLLARDVPIICTNPDKVALKGDSFIKSATYAVAKYRQIGGRVYAYGKPSAIIYKRTFELYPGLKNLRILCVGDTLMTDIKGAVDYGLDSVFITSGILKRLKKDRSSISSFFADNGCIPTYYTECLA